MKKSLLAVAAIGAFASAAQAQSSVTVYGILDAGYVGGNVSSTVASATTKSNLNAFTAQGAESTSRLGFKGTEDLGGGASAFFTVELALNGDSNLGVASSSTSNRQMFVGVKKNGLGDFAVGTQYTPIFNAVAATTAGQTNNMIGDVIYSRTSFNPSSSLTAGATGTASGNDNNLSFTARTAQTLTLNTDTFAGFRAHASLTANNYNSTETVNTPTATTPGAAGGTVTGGVNNQNGWGLGADYTYNKFLIAGAYQAFTATNPYSPAAAQTSTTAAVAATGTPTIFGVNGANTLGTNVHDNQGYVGATYDFGILKAYANWVSRKATVTQNSNYYVKRSAEQIGVRSYLTPTIEAWAVAGLGRYTAYGTGQPTANFNAYQLGANYYLSKRTNLYAIWGVENTSTYATVNATTGAATGTNSNNMNAYALGVRHTF